MSGQPEMVSLNTEDIVSRLRKYADRSDIDGGSVEISGVEVERLQKGIWRVIFVDPWLFVKANGLINSIQIESEYTHWVRAFWTVLTLLESGLVYGVEDVVIANSENNVALNRDRFGIYCSTHSEPVTDIVWNACTVRLVSIHSSTSLKAAVFDLVEQESTYGVISETLLLLDPSNKESSVPREEKPLGRFVLDRLSRLAS